MDVEVSLPGTVLKKVEEIANEIHLSPSEVVVLAIDFGLERLQKQGEPYLVCLGAEDRVKMGKKENVV